MSGSGPRFQLRRGTETLAASGAHRLAGMQLLLLDLPRPAGPAPALATARIAAQPGFSGGPIVDAAGALVGILAVAVAESLDEARTIARDTSGALPVRPVLHLPVREALSRLPAWDHGG